MNFKYLRRIVKAMFQPSSEPNSALNQGDWYLLEDHASGCYYTTCHTTGSGGWTPHRDQAEVMGASNASEALGIYTKIGKQDLHLVKLERTDPRHPYHHHIPAVTKHVKMLRTTDGKWFARAVIDGRAYETVPWTTSDQVQSDVCRGMMYDHILNKELNETNPQNSKMVERRS